MIFQGRYVGCGELFSPRRIVRVGLRPCSLVWAYRLCRSRSYCGVCVRAVWVHDEVGLDAGLVGYFEL